LSVDTVAGGGIARLCGGEIGGKGEGLELIRSMLGGIVVPGLSVAMPRTAILGVDGFEEFLKERGAREALRLEGELTEGDYGALRASFLRVPMPAGLVRRLDEFLPERGRPLIARSSSLLEDSEGEPFSGVYESYAIPNAHPDRVVRLAQLCDAVKLVFASLFSPGASAYREAANCKPEDEAMAVIVQELVGASRGRWFYPLLSGTAQSFNYYPLAYAMPEDGLCAAALGLGSYVVEGGAAHRFCPRYPALNASPPEMAGDESQKTFRALDMEREEPDLSKGESAALEELELAEAEGHSALGLVASTWDRDDGRLVPGTARDGPRILDLAPILKYDAFPFAPAMEAALKAGELATGGPIELEYALDLDPSSGERTLYLLQLKRLARAGGGGGVDLEDLDGEGCFVVSERAMGDGRIGGIRDVVWVDLGRFDRARSREAAEEIAVLDKELAALGRPYILIGPGRWGSRDPWLGLPVAYPQIAHARAIVETEMPGLSVDFSFGSHFLRNVSGRGIGYLAVPSRGKSLVDWEWLGSRPRERELAYCARARLEEPLEILMDGRRGRALVRKRAFTA
jgi:hypothetical protein